MLLFLVVSLLTRPASLDSFGVTGQDCTAVDYNMEVPQPSSYTDVHLGHKIPLNNHNHNHELVMPRLQ